MSRFLPFLIVLLLLVLPGPVPVSRYEHFSAMALSAPKEVRDARAAVYNLSVDGETDCTAFAVKTSTGKDLISAGHCAEGLQPNQVVTAYQRSTGIKFTVILKAFKHHWPDADYSVWTILGTQPVAALETTKEIPSVGDEVWSIMGSRGIQPILTGGTQAGVFFLIDNPTDEKNGMIVISSPGAAPGASGSPVLDSNGRVWGILVGGNPWLPDVSLVVPIP